MNTTPSTGGAVMHIEDRPYCHVHGKAHLNGEMESIYTIPREYLTGDPEEDHDYVEDCREEEREIVVLTPDEYVVTAEQAVQRRRPAIPPLQSGTFAYINSTDGLVPCKVLSIDEWGQACVMITAARPGWVKGRALTIRSPRLSLVSRDQVKHRNGETTIIGTLLIRTDKGRIL